MTEPAHILIVDDDPRVRDMLDRYLTDEGFRVSTAESALTARRALEEEQPDLLLLDLLMPGEDGLSFARQVRSRSNVPIIMITGKGDMVDRVLGLELGADDYITKPFHLREVLARIKTVLRRSLPGTTPSPEPPATADRFAFDGWIFERERRELRSPAGEPVALTTAEFALLAAFVANAQRVLSRDRLMDLVKGHDWTPFDRSIDTLVVRLRKKLEADPKNPRLIKTVRGTGYTFTAKVNRG